jgi:hypothetical protein
MANKLDNLNPFKKGQSGNPKGRPKMTVSVILDQFKTEGYEIPSSTQIKNTYLYLTTMPQDQLKKIVDDKECPMLFRICASNILSKKGFEIVEKMLDRAIGKPTQRTELAADETAPVDFVINIVQGSKTIPYDPD